MLKQGDSPESRTGSLPGGEKDDPERQFTMRMNLAPVFATTVLLGFYWPHVALLLALVLFALIFLGPDDQTPA